MGWYSKMKSILGRQLQLNFVHSSWRLGLLFLWHISTASFNIQETCCCNQRQWRTYTILRSSFLLNLLCIVDISIRKKNHLETCYIWKSAWNYLPIFTIIFLCFKVNLIDTLRRVWRYQRDNQNPYIEGIQTTQWFVKMDKIFDNMYADVNHSETHNLSYR